VTTWSRPVVPSRRLCPGLGCYRLMTSAVCRCHETVGTAKYDWHRCHKLYSFGHSHLEQSTGNSKTVFLLGSNICTENKNFMHNNNILLLLLLFPGFMTASEYAGLQIQRLGYMGLNKCDSSIINTARVKKLIRAAQQRPQHSRKVMWKLSLQQFVVCRR